jgi:hypothetical protein
MVEVIIAAVVGFALGGALFGTIGKNNKKNVETALVDYYEGVADNADEIIDDLKEQLRILQNKLDLKTKRSKAKPAA